MAIEVRSRADELLVEGAKRRAAVARDIARGMQPGAAVALLLHEAQPHQGLKAGDEDAALAQVIFVVERDVIERHRAGLQPLAEPSMGRLAYLPDAPVTAMADYGSLIRPASLHPRCKRYSRRTARAMPVAASAGVRARVVCESRCWSNHVGYFRTSQTRSVHGS